MEHKSTEAEQSWPRIAYEVCYEYVRGLHVDDMDQNAGDTLPLYDGRVNLRPHDFRHFAGFRISSARFVTLLRLCRAMGAQKEVQLFGEGALTVLRSNFEESDLKWALRGLAPDSAGIFNLTNRQPQDGLHLCVLASEHGLLRGPGESVLQDLLDWSKPVLFSTNYKDDLPDLVRMFPVSELEVGALDGEILKYLAALKFPHASVKALDEMETRLPSGADLQLLSTLQILSAFRQSDLPSVCSVLHDRVGAERERQTEKKSQKPKDVRPKSVVPLEEMVGLGEAKDAALGIVASLREWTEGRIPWADVPRGLLLEGPPGTGKTELARAIAGAADINMIATSYNIWQSEGNLSYFLQAMNRSFADAMKRKPSILFLDEIDAFCSRSGLDGNGRNDSYDVKVITALLEKLDGISDREGVVILGACNRLDLLDPAIQRSGRFDTVMRISLPSLTDLAVIFKQHLGQAGEAVDARVCAVAALGLTGADCAAAVRKGKMLARRNKRELDTSDVLVILEGDPVVYSSQDRLRIAAHECGHAIVATVLDVATVEYVRIGASGGVCKLNRLSRLTTKEVLHRERAVNLAGRAAEVLMFGDISAGSGGDGESDIAQATKSAVEQITTLGLGDGGAVWFGTFGSEIMFRAALREHHSEIRSLLDQAEQLANDILSRNRELLASMASDLVQLRVLFAEHLDTHMASISREELRRTGIDEGANS